MLRTDPTLNFLIRERRLCQNLTYLLSPKLIFQESDVIVKEEYKFCFTTCWILVGIYIIETWIWSLTPTLAAKFMKIFMRIFIWWNFYIIKKISDETFLNWIGKLIEWFTRQMNRSKSYLPNLNLRHPPRTNSTPGGA